MHAALISKFVEHQKKRAKSCLACGTRLHPNGRRYCSATCRQKLRRTLDVRSGLLRALNIRYATFSFTDQVIMLDVLPFDDNQIFSFLHPRTPGNVPAVDFGCMANLLGRLWWSEKRRSNKRYLAARHVLAFGWRKEARQQEIQPLEVRLPAVQNAALVYLQLSRRDLNSPELLQTIKRAYRLQAKQHHPDTGGDAATFRKIQNAYEMLLEWAENPAFFTRRGFPDRWFYNGYQNRWVQPAPTMRR